MIDKSVFEMTGRLPQLEDAIRQALRGVPASAITSLGVHSAEVWAQPVTEVDGSVTGVTIVGYDISERVRSKRGVAEIRELQRTIRDRTHFVSTASHELRNPLTSIFACADALAAGGAKNLTPEQQHWLSIIQKSSERLESLIGDLPSLYTGSFDVEIVPVNVSQLMQEIIETQLPIFSRARQVLTLSLPVVDYSVGADRNRLTQVISNLLSNASKHSHEGTEVCLDIAVAGTRLKISVIDNGPGIPADQLGRVWDRGFRLTNEGARTVPGKGLGLPIVRSIVELHGGTATIESTVSIGTTVTVTLPGASVVEIKATEEKPAVAKKAAAKPAGGQRKRQRRAS